MAVSARDPHEQLPAAPEGRGRHARGHKPKPVHSSGAWRWFRETAIIVISALVLSALVRAFLVQAFYVPSESMEDTLLVGDRIIASKITTRLSGISRGEVVVFTDPGEACKQAAADEPTSEPTDQDGQCEQSQWLPDPFPSEGGFRDGLRTVLTFIGLIPSDSGNDLVKRVIGIGGDRVACCDAQGRIVLNGVSLDEDYIIGPTDQVEFDTVVPDGDVFVMGDNRGNSLDSRFHLDVDGGGVPADDVVGRVVLVLWPLSRFATVPIPDIFANPEIVDGPSVTSQAASPSPTGS